MMINHLTIRVAWQVICQELCKISEGEVSFGGTEIRLRFRLRTTA